MVVNMKEIKVKTKAKTIQGRIEAIISAHFYVDENNSIIMHQRNATKMILEQFDVKEKV